ncbi:MAG: ATP-binding cassette domain-containing protein [Zestosphaera sp.]
MSAYAVEIKNLKVSIKGVEILRSIDMKIRKNTISVIMGPSGSGKSTLLRTLNRLTDFMDGIRVEGSVFVG